MVEGQTFTIGLSFFSSSSTSQYNGFTFAYYIVKKLMDAIPFCRTDSDDWNDGLCNMARQLDDSDS